LWQRLTLAYSFRLVAPDGKAMRFVASGPLVVRTVTASEALTGHLRAVRLAFAV